MKNASNTLRTLASWSRIMDVDVGDFGVRLTSSPIILTHVLIRVVNTDSRSSRWPSINSRRPNIASWAKSAMKRIYVHVWTYLYEPQHYDVLYEQLDPQM